MAAAAGRRVVCVTTSKPQTSVTSVGGASSLVVLCPNTGSTLTSLRAIDNASTKQSALGINSLSPFPKPFSTASANLALGYGVSSRKDDTYALLLTIRSGTSQPIVHWRCRLPESRMRGGLLVSPCGNYIVGGGESGTIYVWKSIGGALLRTAKAHYRTITVMTWSKCGRFLYSGGADGMIHAFSIISLVEYGATSALVPIRTWSKHQLPVTAIVAIDGGRILSGSDDGQLILMESCSGSVLATIHLGYPVTAITENDSRIYAGTQMGVIYVVDLGEYAMNKTAQQGAFVTDHRSQHFMSRTDEVFGTRDHSAGTKSYLSELRGHSRAVTSLVISVHADASACLISGDTIGEIRYWDVSSRACVRVTQPWAPTGTDIDMAKASPVAAMVVVSADEGDALGAGGIFDTATTGRTGDKKRGSNMSSLVSPLQRFAQDTHSPMRVPGPSQGSCKTVDSFLDVSSRQAQMFDYHTALRRRRRKNDLTDSTASDSNQDVPESSTSGENDSAARAKLEKELAEARSTIKRWETVNNELISRLNNRT